jgi:predicted dehydrogenase
VVTQYIYPGGPQVYAEGSWLLTKGFNMAYTLHCERATLDFDLARGADAMVVTESGKEPRVIKYDGPDGYGQEVKYLVDCALAGKSPEIVTAQDGLTALEICEAEEKSVKTGQVVKV